MPERKLGVRKRPATCAIDEHAAAVKTWLGKLVIGMNLCPWAKTAEESGGIKVPAWFS